MSFDFAPLPYHDEIRAYLKAQERALWDWFSSAKAQENYTERVRLDLLKSTYRFDAAGHEALYAGVEEVKARLSLEIPVTLYQARDSPQPNATLYFVPGEGHIVFSGAVLTLLSPLELLSIVAHELAHYHLWTRDQGEFHVADRLLQAVADDPRSSPSHEETALRYRLYTELFADRGSLRATSDLHSVVAALVKIQTGISNVSAESYLKQAGEIFADGPASSEGVSHPESFIRARALVLWNENAATCTGDIRAMIEGAGAFDRLDLLEQTQLTALTRTMLQGLLRPRWFQTSATLGHAKLYFADFEPGVSENTVDLDGKRLSDGKIREYLSYVLLDFVTVDPELEEVPLAAAWGAARRFDLESAFEKLLAKELKMKAADIRTSKEQAARILAKAEDER